MASGQPTVSTPANHPVLGPAVSLYADRSHSLGMVFLGLAFIGVALLGFVLGSRDLLGGTSS